MVGSKKNLGETPKSSRPLVTTGDDSMTGIATGKTLRGFDQGKLWKTMGTSKIHGKTMETWTEREGNFFYWNRFCRCCGNPCGKNQ